MRKSYDKAFKVKVAPEAERDRLLTIAGELNGEGDFLKKCGVDGRDPKWLSRILEISRSSFS